MTSWYVTMNEVESYPIYYYVRLQIYHLICEQIIYFDFIRLCFIVLTVAYVLYCLVRTDHILSH